MSGTTYGGWRNERIGFLGGASLTQVSVVLLCTIPAWWCITQQAWLDAAGWLLFAAACAVAVFARVKERVAYEWVVQSGAHLLGMATRVSDFRSKAAGGALTEGDMGALDLPGPLARMRVHDGPPLPGQSMQRVCLLQDGSDWVIVAAVTHPGLSIADPSAADRYAQGLGEALANQSRTDTGPRVLSLYVRSIPDDGAERAAWHTEHARSDVPQALVDSTDELEAAVSTTAIGHELYVALRFAEDDIAKAARAAGGGVAGRAAVIYRTLPGVESGLTGAGCQKVTWLTTGRLAAAIRTGYNPGEQAGIAVARARNARTQAGGARAFEGVDPVAAGPSQAPGPAPRSYQHDAYRTVAYTLILPDLGTKVGRLRPLLTPARVGERRALALHYEPLSVKDAQKKTERDESRAAMATEMKRQRGFKVSSRQRRVEEQTRQQEQMLAAGHTLVRVAGAVSVTVPAGQEVETNAALLEAGARAGGYSLMRLDLAQDAGFVASVLPVGIGLPRRGK